jgi:predicted transcriptional regulator
MITNGTDKQDFAGQITEILDKEPGLSVKELAERLKTNRQYMAGILKVLEEQGNVYCRKVGPARIYYANLKGKRK